MTYLHHMKNSIATLLFAIVTPAFDLYAQEASSSNMPKELTLNLSEDGTRYLKWTFLNQVWLRYNDSNPGTTVLGEPFDETFDIGLRRTRIQFFGQLTDHVFFYTQFGQNNFNFLTQQQGNRKLQAFFHDALGEYKVWKGHDHLKIGAGLTITNGLSRFTQPSIGTIVSMDVPIFAQATVEQIDGFGRKLSVYARGQLGKLDYRIVLSDPFPITTTGQTPPPLGPAATFAHVKHHKQLQGFFMVNLFDKEPHTTPYMTGTYLGKKKIFNVEAGFISQKDALWSSPDDGVTTTFHAMNLWSIALFYDAPIDPDKGTALSAYTGYFNYDYGPDYLRYGGIMNPADGIVNGPYSGSHGNSFPMFGTGNVVYAQLGYLIKQGLLGEAGALMPYATLMSARFDRLRDPVNVTSIGLNWLVKGHGSKITLDYQIRPVFEAQGQELVKTSSKSQVVLQYQISF